MNILADEQLKMLEPGLDPEEYDRQKENFFDLYYRMRKKKIAGIAA